MLESRCEKRDMKPLTGPTYSQVSEEYYKDIQERRLKEWQNYRKSHRSAEDQKCNRVFIDISVDNKLIGRLIIELFDRDVPKTVAHFRSFITGASGMTREGDKKLDYLNSSLYCVDRVRHLLCFGDMGDLLDEGLLINEELFRQRHSEAGLLTMMTEQPNCIGTRFGITSAASPTLDFHQVVFGKVVDGHEVLDKLCALPTNEAGRPLSHVNIALCGALTGTLPSELRR